MATIVRKQLIIYVAHLMFDKERKPLKMDPQATCRLNKLLEHLQAPSAGRGTGESQLERKDTLASDDVSLGSQAVDLYRTLTAEMPFSAKRNGGQLVAKVLQAHGVKFIFTLCGGHISPM